MNRIRVTNLPSTMGEFEVKQALIDEIALPSDFGCVFSFDQSDSSRALEIEIFLRNQTNSVCSENTPKELETNASPTTDTNSNSNINKTNTNTNTNSEFREEDEIQTRCHRAAQRGAQALDGFTLGESTLAANVIEMQAQRKNLPWELFDCWAVFDKDIEMEQGNETYKLFLEKHIPWPDKPFRALELGCSNGWACRKVAKMKPQSEIFGIDVSPMMIKKGKFLLEKEDPPISNVTLQVSDLLDYVPEQKFDVVFSFATLYYVIPMERIGEKLAQWLNPGAVFAMGIDYFTENLKCHHWDKMLNIEMDLRSIGAWEEMFRDSYKLDQVQKHLIDYQWSQEGEVGTLFLSGVWKKNLIAIDNF